MHKNKQKKVWKEEADCMDWLFPNMDCVLSHFVNLSEFLQVALVGTPLDVFFFYIFDTVSPQ